MASVTGPTRKSVGFVGAGSMGGPMIARLLAAGVPVRLFARRPEVGARFAALGAEIVGSIADVAASTSVVLVCPFSEQQLTEIAEPILAAPTDGLVLVQHATVSLRGIQDLAGRAATHGVTVLDAPISGQAQDIADGNLAVLLGGDDAAIRRAEPYLRTYSRVVIRVGDVGAATAAKLVNNLMFAAQVQVAAAGLALGAQFGLAADDLIAALCECSANSVALATIRTSGVDRFVQLAGPYLRKDVAVVEEVARALGVDLGALAIIVHDGPFPLTTG